MLRSESLSLSYVFSKLVCLIFSFNSKMILSSIISPFLELTGSRALLILWKCLLMVGAWFFSPPCMLLNFDSFLEIFSFLILTIGYWPENKLLFTSLLLLYGFSPYLDPSLFLLIRLIFDFYSSLVL